MYKVIKDFSGSPDGCRVIEYETGQILNVGTDFSADLVEVALAEQWVIEQKPARKKAVKKAAKKK